MSDELRTLVTDASVILKWVLDSDDEPGREDAVAILESFVDGNLRLAVPSLWVYEVGNILSRKRPATARDTMTALLDLGLEEVPLGSVLAGRTLELALDKGITFYDASYVAVAENRDAGFVTADRRLAERLGQGFRVRLVGVE
jgi:predicted nucleic acid-binding protein